MRMIDADGLIDEICRAECEKAHADCDYRGGRCESVKAVMESPTVGGCISVKDRLPDEYDCYLAYSYHGWDILFYDLSNGWWLNMGYRVMDGEVTHWMPLPEPPAKEVR